MNFLLHFRNPNQYLNTLKEKITLVSYVFPKLRTAKDDVRKVSKKPCFRAPFNSQHAKGSQTLMKS